MSDLHPQPEPEARRSAFAAAVTEQTGIDEAMIERLVHRFYERIRADAVLGPVFAARISDWEPHLERMCAFWSSVVLMSGRYHGRPMQKHAPLSVGGEHFDRWLALFAETARAECPTAAAVLFVEKAGLIAGSLQLGMATFRGVTLKPGERLDVPAGHPLREP